MNLKSGTLYWPTTLANQPSFPILEEDIHCDVLIIGGGSSGAQCAHYLRDTGLRVVVVEKNKIGYGSTATNTALIQYSGAKMAHQLVNSFGLDFTLKHLKNCEEAIQEIERAQNAETVKFEFTRRDSLYYASYEDDVLKLQKDYQVLKDNGFQVEWLNEEEIGNKYPFKKRAAIYTYNDAELNPFRFTMGILDQVRRSGVQVFEQTEIVGKRFEKEYAVFYTKNKHAIKAQHVIMAAGYENLEFKVEKNALLTSSYAVITNPIEDFSSWHNRSLIWETARPYIYMRTTMDNRVIIGGLDETTVIAEERDSMLKNKKERLIEEFNKLFPMIDVHPAYYIAAFYGGTHDGLPIIGRYDEFPRCYFLMGYGDNGMVYSMVFAKILRDVITKGNHPHLDMYLQTRPRIHTMA